MPRLAVGSVIGAVLIGSLLFSYVVIYPRVVLARYDDFVARHGTGTDVGSMTRDPFVRKATMTFVDDKPLDKTDELAAVVGREDHGSVHLMWTHTPPFGRVSYTVTFEHGSITSARTASID